MLASRENGCFASLRVAARRVSRRAASSSVALSASIHWIAWKSAIGFPNCCRSRAYLVDASRAAWAMPQAWLAMPMRPPSRAIIAILKPPPSSPSRALSGTKQRSSVRGTVLEARSPILSSALPGFIPGFPRSTRKQEIPRVPAPPVRAQTTNTPAWAPEVIHCFCPSSRYPPSTLVAVVLMPPGSLPASGSLRAKAPAR